MDFLRIDDRLLPIRTFTVWLCIAITSASFTCAYGQGRPKDLLLPGKPDYISLSGNGKKLFDGLTNSRQYPGETIIVRMLPIAEALTNNRLTITIPGRGDHYDVHVKNIEYSDDRNYKVYGTVGESPLSVLLTSRKGVKGGMIQGPERSYEICDLGDDGQLLLTHENDAGQQDFCVSGVGSAIQIQPESDPDKHGRMPGDNAKIEACTSGIRVLFVYPNDVSPVSAANHASNTIDVFNQTVINSGVIGTALAESAGVVQTTYQTTTGIIADEAFNLSNNANVQALRAQYKADLVLWFTWTGYNNAFGGVPDPKTYLHPVDARAFAVVSLGGTNIPVIGAHELSHLFGCNHNDDNFGLPYSKGYVFGIFNTLVAKGNAPGSKIFYYSNPNKSIAGFVMGDATHNNAKVMNDRAAIVKAFRAEPNVLNGWVYGPYSGYEYQVYTYEAISRCGNPPYTYQWQESTDGINYSGNGTGEFHNVGLHHNGNHQFYLKLKITSSDGQTVENWMQIWVDDDPNGGYRKGQKENDSLQIERGETVLRPNPASNQVELVFNAEKAMEVEVGIVDLNGREHMRGQFFQCLVGRNVISIDLTGKGLVPGVYIFAVRDGTRVIRRKMIYQPTVKP
nr:T9SS type A sorting domain-containing protein [uncultured Dyadobacter sp.]